MKGVTTCYIFFFGRKHPRRKRIDHVILLGSQGPCSGLSKLLFARIGEREERDDMFVRLSSFLYAELPSLLATKYETR
jgi:hypothetical protein